ncbi:MAG: D-glucuronyl C5-epimerase family protein, partial [Microcella sp.]|nr:D-glucuronyl C5-epimerase family protein [Microcella sp.]
MLRLRRGYGSIVRRLRRTRPPVPVTPIERVRDALPELSLDTSTDGLRLRAVSARPYAATQPMPPKRRPIDPNGRHVWRDKTGHVRPHPVAQAQYALATLESYRLSGRNRDLKQSIVNARDARRRGRNGFAPYTFDFALHGEADNTIHAPWYSAMAQGQLLSLASRLDDLTSDTQFAAFARELFETLAAEYRHDALPDSPWVTFVDAEGMLWFEEYAGDVEPMRVLNGHLFA